MTRAAPLKMPWIGLRSRRVLTDAHGSPRGAPIHAGKQGLVGLITGALISKRTKLERLSRLPRSGSKQDQQ